MLIGLTGFARTGKDTVADFMVEDYEFTKFSFADPMREALVRLDPYITVGGNYVTLSQVLDKFSWDELKALSPDIRPLLQKLGTEVGRSLFGENFWVNIALESVEKAGVENAVFADVRFKNEAQAIKDAGGILIRISRPGFGPANNHISETEMVDYPVDYHINNSADLAKLSSKVSVLLAASRAWS
jgi:hypothetical protein